MSHVLDSFQPLFPLDIRPTITCFKKVFYHFLNKADFCHDDSNTACTDNTHILHLQLRDVINTLRARIIYFAHHLSLSDRHKAECLAQSRLHHLLKHKWHEWLWVCLHTVFTFLYFWTFGLLPSWHRHKESYGVFPSALGLIIFFKETTRQQKIYIYLKWIHL